MKLISQSAIIILSFLAVYMWQKIGFFIYTVPLIGFIIFMYLFISSRRKDKNLFNLDGNSLWTIWLLNTLILLLIFSTGNITSPIFFLLYFLGFGIAFVFEPAVIFVFLLGAILLFLPEALQNDVNGNLLRLGSLLLITPLAYFFGSEYRKTDKKQEEIEKMSERTKEAAGTISKNVEEIIEEEKLNLSSKATDNLNKILEETEDLREEEKEITLK
ncbi:MAG: hypothetical protein V1697_02960 [Candidatus Levyibacteriota bacterium]